MFRNVRTVALPLGLLINALLWGGCGHLAFSPLEDLCAEHTIVNPGSVVVDFPGFEGYWRPTEDNDTDVERVIPLRPFGGGSSIIDALYNVDRRKLVKFYYGAPL